MKITICNKGPYLVTGSVPLETQTLDVNSEGESVEWSAGKTYPTGESYKLCRCGHSNNKPFCDETHVKSGFKGSETADRTPYLEQADRIEGPAAILTDAQSFCVGSRFCDPNNGVWNMIEKTDDPEVRRKFIRQVGDCPAGRLVAWDKETAKVIEPHFEPSIGLVEDPIKDCSGPIWVRGGIPIIGSDGEPYETRNRVTLCRCGASQKKPFCDGTHFKIHFKAE